MIVRVMSPETDGSVLDDEPCGQTTSHWCTNHLNMKFLIFETVCIR